MNTSAKWIKLFCREKVGAKNLTCRNYLGDLRIDVPGTSRHYCKNCNHLIEFEVTPSGEVSFEVLPKTYRTEALDSVAMVRK